jgi:hypothetical protein
MTTKKKAVGFAPERRHATLKPAKAVRIAREFQQMTQTEFAAASGVPQPALGRWDWHPPCRHGEAKIGGNRANTCQTNFRGS